jgi:hypothetical protein
MFSLLDRNAQSLAVILRRNYSAKATLFLFCGRGGQANSPANLRPQKRFASTGIFFISPYSNFPDEVLGP